MVEGNDGEVTHVTLSPKLKNFTERTKKVADVMEDLRLKDVFSTLRGWRNEASQTFDLNVELYVMHTIERYIIERHYQFLFVQLL